MDVSPVLPAKGKIILCESEIQIFIIILREICWWWYLTPISGEEKSIFESDPKKIALVNSVIKLEK